MIRLPASTIRSTAYLTRKQMRLRLLSYTLLNWSNDNHPHRVVVRMEFKIEFMSFAPTERRLECLESGPNHRLQATRLGDIIAVLPARIGCAEPAKRITRDRCASLRSAHPTNHPSTHRHSPAQTSMRGIAGLP
jgi:hypothetical protein